MDFSPLVQARMDDARRAAAGLFSSGTVEEMQLRAEALLAQPGLDLLMTPVPWEISFDVGGHRIAGLSETMEAAVRDIQAQLGYAGLFRAEVTGAGEIVRIAIDPVRMQHLGEGMEL